MSIHLLHSRKSFDTPINIKKKFNILIHKYVAFSKKLINNSMPEFQEFLIYQTGFEKKLTKKFFTVQKQSKVKQA